MSRRRLISLAVFLGVQLAAVAAIVGYDVWAYERWGDAGTVSQAVRAWVQTAPLGAMVYVWIVGSVIGGLFVHFFYERNP